ncbi:hypothetical protein O181_104525 [Austropuccinia psidii MF-1]|uniref:Uncharacterized protein n=1 Tax=Austropuccinia psidii MF-1 TaxID=1389203 RepID=A0A9Q3JK26_9BASI|nr:hypothetical protein [Austropuccinia psidii MF-1]
MVGWQHSLRPPAWEVRWCDVVWFGGPFTRVVKPGGGVVHGFCGSFCWVVSPVLLGPYGLQTSGYAGPNLKLALVGCGCVVESRGVWVEQLEIGERENRK